MPEYPTYHCLGCGFFFKDAEGIQKEGLYGQQLKIIEIICEDCRRQDEADEEAS